MQVMTPQNSQDRADDRAEGMNELRAVSVASESARAMSRFQLRAIAVCTLLQALDGFDILVMAFAAPGVSASWDLSGSQLGLLFSSGVAGLAVGSLLIAPFGDRLGRRPVALLCLSVITLGMTISAFARTAVELGVLRFVTGVGVGGIVPTLNVITAEYASGRYRRAALAIQATGYPVGATVGGWIATSLIMNYGWRAAFLLGGLASALTLPLVFRCIPESMEFLIARRPAGALEQLNRLRRQMRLPSVSDLAELVAARPHGGSAFVERLSAPSVLPLCAAFFLISFGISFVQNWTSKLLIDAGLSAEQGLTAGVVLNLGGILGGVLMSCCVARFDPRRIESICLASGALAMIAFGMGLSELAWAIAIALLMGISLAAAIIGLAVVGPSIFPAEVRATGMGVSIGAGRIGAIVSPIIAGILVDASWQPEHLYGLFAMPIAATLLAVRALPKPEASSSASAR
jgi:benzoate transport